jgi:spermidine synthase
MSALAYQVVWVRMFGLIFGNTIDSASIITSIFMFGLGIGSYIAGGLADTYYARNPAAPLKLYAYSEIFIAVLATLVALIFPCIESLSPAFSSYTLDTNGWHTLTLPSYLFRYVVAIVLLTPITLLMGGTLTLLIRFMVGSELPKVGWYIGLLYGFNTAGAALSCWGVDFFTIPRLGLFATQLLGVTFNLLAGLGALTLLKHSVPAKNRTLPINQESSDTDNRAATKLLFYICLAVFLSGFAAMGLEILWFRYLISSLGAYRTIFSQLLMIVLIGIWLGSLSAAWLMKRFGAPHILLMITQLLMALSTLFTWMAIEPDKHQHALGFIIGIVALPSFFMGFAYPLSNGIAQSSKLKLARHAGVIYLYNTIGAVCGSLLTGFFLLPKFGMESSLIILLLCAMITILPLYGATQWMLGAEKISARTTILLIFLCCINFGLLKKWSHLPAHTLAIKSLFSEKIPADKIIHTSEGVLETIAIVDKTQNHESSLALYTNGHSMSNTSMMAQRYMRSFAHLPLLQLSQPKRVLVICFGVGNTLHAASLHPSVDQLEVVDISKHVLEQAGFFAATNGNVLKDPRVKVFINDGRQHLRMQNDGIYDLITLEPPPLQFAGVSTLYTKEFYQLAQKKLKPGGFITQWLPVQQLPGEMNKSLVRSFIDVFPNTVLLDGYIGQFILMGRNKASITIDPTQIMNKIRTNTNIQNDLRKINLEQLTEIIGMFAANASTLREAVKTSEPMTDDQPRMEYANVIGGGNSLPPELFDVHGVKEWCKDCFNNDKPIATLRNLPTYLAIMSTLYANIDLHSSVYYSSVYYNDKPNHLLGRNDNLDDLSALKNTYNDNPYLQHILPNLNLPNSTNPKNP